MTDPLQILTHEFFPKRGGIALYVHEMALAADPTATVWAPAHPLLLEQSLRLPYPVKPLPIRGTMDWSDRIGTAKTIRKNAELFAESTLYIPEPGAIITAMYLNAIGRLPAKRVVLTLHGSEILRFSKTPHRRLLFRKLLQRAERVGVVSKFVQNLLLEKYPNFDGKVVIVSGALRSDFSVLENSTKIETPDARLTLLTCGRIHPRKGQHRVLEALGRLPADLQQHIRYRIAGPIVKKEYAATLRALAQSTQASIEFLGDVPDEQLAQTYRDADVFIMTSDLRSNSVEGFGLVYLEAAACGLPVIAQATGGVPEAVLDGRTGIVVPPNDLDAIANAIKQLAVQPDLRKKLAEGGLCRLKDLSWEKNWRALFG